MSGAKPITVGIADDHFLVRAGFRRLLSACEDMQVLGEAVSAQEALQMVRTMDVDVLLLDYSMPQRTGLEVLPEIRAAAPRTKVVMVSSFPEDMLRDRALRAGAFDYVQKTSVEPLLNAIRAAAAHSG